MIATLRGASVAQARRAMAEQFREAGIESPDLDARVLIGHALRLDHAGLATAATQQISDLAATQIERFTARRLAGEPVARIVGQKEFWSLPLTVTDNNGVFAGSLSGLATGAIPLGDPDSLGAGVPTRATTASAAPPPIWPPTSPGRSWPSSGPRRRWA